jgi:hypothetical protein
LTPTHLHVCELVETGVLTERLVGLLPGSLLVALVGQDDRLVPTRPRQRHGVVDARIGRHCEHRLPVLFRVWSVCVVVAYSEVENQLDPDLCDQPHRGRSAKLPGVEHQFERETQRVDRGIEVAGLTRLLPPPLLEPAQTPIAMEQLDGPLNIGWPAPATTTSGCGTPSLRHRVFNKLRCVGIWICRGNATKRDRDEALRASGFELGSALAQSTPGGAHWSAAAGGARTKRSALSPLRRSVESSALSSPAT